MHFASCRSSGCNMQITEMVKGGCELSGAGENTKSPSLLCVHSKQQKWLNQTSVCVCAEGRTGQWECIEENTVYKALGLAVLQVSSIGSSATTWSLRSLSELLRFFPPSCWFELCSRPRWFSGWLSKLCKGVRKHEIT